MKYLTKEWWSQELLADTYDFLNVSKRAERKDEKYYEKLYRLCSNRFVKNESCLDLYRDPQEDIRRYDEMINEQGISEEEKQIRITIKDAFLYTQKDRIEKDTYYEFDKPLAELIFAEEWKRRIKLYRNLPKEILDKVADIRVLALGIASKEVKKLLKPYCEQLRRINGGIKLNARIEMNDAEESLGRDFELNDFSECMLLGIKNIGGNVYVYFGDFKVLVKKGEICECETDNIYPLDLKVPNSGWSMALETELYKNENTYEIHFLMENMNEFGERELWYLTVKGTGIKIIR